MSYYSLKNKYIFLHIPKNAGTAIKFALQNNDPTLRAFDDLDKKHRKSRDPAYGNHLPYWKIESLVNSADGFGAIQDMKVFMVIRNPWERMVSLYHHRLRKLHWQVDGKPRNTPQDIACAQRGFIPWLLGTPHQGDKVLTRVSQLSWAHDIAGNVRTTHTMRQEHMSDIWEGLCEELGLPKIHLKKANVGKGEAQAYKKFYDADSKAHISKYFADDIKAFGYEF